MTQGAVPGVPAKATQGTEAQHREIGWAEASIWTDRMVSALANGVKGGKWFSLADKVIRPSTLDAAWRQVARNKGAAGVDCMVIVPDMGGRRRALRSWIGLVDRGHLGPAGVAVRHAYGR